jgi:hypothetical protein
MGNHILSLMNMEVHQVTRQGWLWEVECVSAHTVCIKLSTLARSLTTRWHNRWFITDGQPMLATQSFLQWTEGYLELSVPHFAWVNRVLQACLVTRDTASTSASLFLDCIKQIVSQTINTLTGAKLIFSINFDCAVVRSFFVWGPLLISRSILNHDSKLECLASKLVSNRCKK